MEAVLGDNTKKKVLVQLLPPKNSFAHKIIGNKIDMNNTIISDVIEFMKLRK